MSKKYHQAGELDHQAGELDHQAVELDHQAGELDHQAVDHQAVDGKRRGLLAWRKLLTERVQETKEQIRACDKELRSLPN